MRAISLMRSGLPGAALLRDQAQRHERTHNTASGYWKPHLKTGQHRLVPAPGLLSISELAIPHCIALHGVGLGRCGETDQLAVLAGGMPATEYQPTGPAISCRSSLCAIGLVERFSAMGAGNNDKTQRRISWQFVLWPA